MFARSPSNSPSGLSSTVGPGPRGATPARDLFSVGLAWCSSEPMHPRSNVPPGWYINELGLQVVWGLVQGSVALKGCICRPCQAIVPVGSELPARPLSLRKRPHGRMHGPGNLLLGSVAFRGLYFFVPAGVSSSIVPFDPSSPSFRWVAGGHGAVLMMK